MTPLRIVFMGTPDFSVPPLKALLDKGHEVVAIYSQPPRPAGRGEKVRKSPVHTYGEEHGIPVLCPTTLKSEEAQQIFADQKPDLAVVVAYGMILPKAILDIPAYGCLNIHASLLPRWRGAAPIQRAIEAGDDTTGITIMQMDQGLDTGDMVWTAEVPIEREETGQTLHDKLSLTGAEALLQALEHLQDGTLSPQKQPEDGITYAAKLSREESQVDWSQSAQDIERKLRAFTPWPGLYFVHDNQKIKILSGETVSGDGPPGEVLDEDLTVACGQGALRILELQRPGKPALEAKAFLNGYSLPAGTKLLP